jgi:hypothetical protein
VKRIDRRSTAFLRHRRYSSTDAQDRAQAFFAHLLAQNTLSHADQDEGPSPQLLMTAYRLVIQEVTAAEVFTSYTGRRREGAFGNFSTEMSPCFNSLKPIHSFMVFHVVSASSGRSVVS